MIVFVRPKNSSNTIPTEITYFYLVLSIAYLEYRIGNVNRNIVSEIGKHSLKFIDNQL